MATSHDDDDWFKPRGNGNVATAEGSAPRIQPAAPTAPKVEAGPLSKPAAVPTRPATRSSGISSRVGAPVPSPVAKKKVAPSARMAAVEPKAETDPEAAPIVQPKKSSRISAVKQPVAPASRGGSSRRISAVQANAAPAPAAEEDVQEMAGEPEQDVVTSPSRGKSSRRMPAAKGSARASAARGRSEERDEKDSKKDKKKGGKKDDKMPMYIGAGVVAVLLIGAFVALGRGKEEEVSAKKPVEEAVDKTPSGKYARMAEDALSSGSKSKAVDFYTKAAGQAEREGNTSQARNYSMKAMNLIKSSKLSDR